MSPRRNGEDKKSSLIVREGERTLRRFFDLGRIVGRRSWNRIGLLLLLASAVGLILPAQALGTSLLVVLLLAILFEFATANIRKFSPDDKDLLFLTLLMVAMLVVTKVALAVFPLIVQILPQVPPSAYLYGIGIAAGAMLVRIVLNSETALIFSLVASTFAGWMLPNGLFFSLYFFIGSVVGAHSVAQCEDRTVLIKAGVKVGLANMLTILCLSLIGPSRITPELGYHLLFGFLGGVVNAIAVLGILPILEWVFGYTTDIKLLELANLNHPLIKRMLLEAPGTYHHSLMVGTLAETAARAVNANPLLARVAAYYHDIGKLSMPLYFVENQSGHDNKHAKLAPSMSSLILTSHVKDGLELARQHRLGRKILNIIQQHHGTNLISYFYKKAKEQENRELEQVEEEAYRYRGPKPQTKEAGLVLLADVAEASSRTLLHPTPARLQGLVQRTINHVFTDGQLNECELTLRDLHQIAKSFNLILSGIHHQRIQYPEALMEGTGRRKDNGDLGKQPAKAGAARHPEHQKGGEEDLKRLGI
ncbi:MAG: HDIG domain-containing protein [Deltaproteobacteria bacterium]|nr:HDIG domain-containing protein [Deltaproteobacteria bacterium]